MMITKLVTVMVDDSDEDEVGDRDVDEVGDSVKNPRFD